MRLDVVKNSYGYEVIGRNAFTKHFDTEVGKNQYLLKLRMSAAKVGGEGVWVIPSDIETSDYEFYIEHTDGKYYIIKDEHNKVVKVPGKDNAASFARTLSLKNVFIL